MSGRLEASVKLWHWGAAGLVVPALLRGHLNTQCDVTPLALAASERCPGLHLGKLDNVHELTADTFLRRALRSLARLVYLCVLIGPLLIMWPLRWSEVTSNYWWMYCVSAAEASGAVVIKLAQWASSRPDLFGEACCNRFKFLQDRTRPHPWADTERTLDASFAEWRRDLILEEVPVGSGCIAQVYRGSLREGHSWRPVAVKVLHPGVRSNVQSDVDLLCTIGALLQSIPRVRWLNPKGMMDEFAQMLIMQLDLRGEARNLQKFRQNFATSCAIVFPDPVPLYTSSDILVESFIEGVPFLVLHVVSPVA